MLVTVTEPQRIAVEAAVRSEKRTRSWQRYQAIFLLAEGQSPAAVAQAVRCCVGSVSHCARRWQAAELAGVAEGPHPGVARRLDAPGETRLAALLATDPQQRGDQATGWTVPLRRTDLVVVGYRVSEHTVRRPIHRLGYRWKRPQSALGRLAPAYAEIKGR